MQQVGFVFLFLHVYEAMSTDVLGTRTAQIYQGHGDKSASHLAHHVAAMNTRGEVV